MIDNYENAMKLLEKMKTHLPIPVISTKDLLNNMRQNNIDVSKEHQFQIENVVYMGDMGGIGCEISPKGAEKVLITSLTHLRIHSGHALSKEIKSYQKKRKKKLARLRH